MRFYYRVLYLSMNSGVDRKNLPQPWWDAFQFTRAVKHGRIKGYCRIPRGFFKLKVNEGNVIEARRFFGAWLDGVAREQTQNGNFVLVPVPSKDSYVGSRAPYRHISMMTDALSILQNKPTVSDLLQYTERLPKASEGGPRTKGEIYEKLRIKANLPEKPIILIDDVVTGGGHIRAAAQRLEEAGATVLYAIVCGRTVWDTEGDPWAAGEDEFVNPAALDW